MEKIFISHSQKDKEIIKYFVDDILVGALSIKVKEIFCTSIEGTKIKSGEDWRGYIKDRLINSKITFLIITPNYKESEICLNEMGASWVCSSMVIPLIVEPVSYSSIGVLQEPKQIEKILDEGSLDRIKDRVQEILNIPIDEIRSDRWTTKKKEFIIKTRKILTSNPFAEAMDRKTFEKIIKEKKDIEQNLNALIEEKIHLENINKELINTKDREEVKEIQKKYSSDNLFDDFIDLCTEIKTEIEKKPSIIIGIMYKTYSDKYLEINISGYESYISDAVSRDIITDELEADWTTTREMRSIYSKLKKLNTFISKNNLNDSFIEEYESNYDAPLSLSNLDFWENVLRLNVLLN